MLMWQKTAKKRKPGKELARQSVFVESKKPLCASCLFCLGQNPSRPNKNNQHIKIILSTKVFVIIIYLSRPTNLANGLNLFSSIPMCSTNCLFFVSHKSVKKNIAVPAVMIKYFARISYMCRPVLDNKWFLHVSAGPSLVTKHIQKHASLLYDILPHLQLTSKLPCIKQGYLSSRECKLLPTVGCSCLHRKMDVLGEIVSISLKPGKQKNNFASRNI